MLGGGLTDFYQAQNVLIDAYESGLDPGRPHRIAIGRVIVPLDSADPKQRERYREYAASRYARTLAPQNIPNGPRGVLFPVDLVGTSDEILHRLAEDPVIARVSELRVELPYEFELHEYEQILHDVRHHLAPQLGWAPTNAGAQPTPEAAAAGLGFPT
jgi:hypothetical protein